MTLVLGLATAGLAKAQVRRVRLSLQMQGCENLDAITLARLLSLELAAVVHTAIPETQLDLSPQHPLVQVACAVADRVDVVVNDGKREAFRSLSLATVDERVRARVVALAIAEIFEAVPHAAPLEPAAQAASPAPKKDVAPAAAVPAYRRHALTLQALHRSFLNERQSTWGTGADLATEWSPRLALGAALHVEQGHAQRQPGEVRLRALSLSLRALYQARTRFGLGLAVGGGASAGYIEARGEPRLLNVTAGTVAGAWAGAFAQGEIFYDWQRFRLTVWLQSGRALVTIQGRTELQDENLWQRHWISAALAMGWTF